MDSQSSGNLFDRFPALGRLVPGAGRRQVPFQEQHTAADCGAACLGMVLAYHGRYVRMEELRESLGSDREGTRADLILDGARHYGLRARGVSLDMDDLDYLEPATILYWEFRHFVVFERLHEDSVELVDPAIGRRRVPLEQFRGSFTGVALLFEPGEGFTRGGERHPGVWKHARQLFHRANRLPGILVLSVLLQFLTLALPLLTGALVDWVVPREDYRLLGVLGAGLAGVIVFQFLASLVRAHLLLELRTLVDARLMLGFVEHLLSLPYAFFQRRSAGDLMMRLNSNTTLREVLTSSVLSGTLDGGLASVYLVLVLLFSPQLGVLVIGLSALQMAVFLVSRQRQRELLTESLHRQARSQSHEVEMLGGIETLKALGCEQRAVDRWADLYVDMLNVSVARGRLSAVVDSLLSTLRLASPLLVLGFGGYLVMSGQLSLGSMLALSSLAVGVLTPLGNLVNTAMQLQLLGSYAERIDDVLETAPEQKQGIEHRRTPRLRGQISVEDVTFRYGPASAPVVRGVSVNIQPGQVVAIVGASGSGKSTLASLLLGLYPPTEGRILYDGIPLEELDLKSVRRQLGIVTQRPYLFGMSIRANISLSDPTAPLEAIMEAARRACLHEEIEAMGLSYETPLVDGGASLSGGQRQRLALARALLGRPAVLLLDEATSALDTLTERRVQESLAGFGCTQVVISHRLSTISHADLILVMDKGRIVEQGRHAELMLRQGLYSQLVGAQLGPGQALSSSGS